MRIWRLMGVVLVVFLMVSGATMAKRYTGPIVTFEDGVTLAGGASVAGGLYFKAVGCAIGVKACSFAGVATAAMGNAIVFTRITGRIRRSLEPPVQAEYDNNHYHRTRNRWGLNYNGWGF